VGGYGLAVTVIQMSCVRYARVSNRCFASEHAHKQTCCARPGDEVFQFCVIAGQEKGGEGVWGIYKHHTSTCSTWGFQLQHIDCRTFPTPFHGSFRKYPTLMNLIGEEFNEAGIGYTSRSRLEWMGEDFGANIESREAADHGG
jgi:hypothetical protein